MELIRRFLKSGVMENGLYVNTQEGFPQGGLLGLPLANNFLDEFDKEIECQGASTALCADDSVVLAEASVRRNGYSNQAAGILTRGSLSLR